MSLSAGPPSIREVLLSSGLLADKDLSAALAEQRSSGKRLVELLLSPSNGRAAVSEHALVRVLADALGLEVVTLGSRDVAGGVLSRVPSELALTRQVLPLLVEDGALTVAVADPLDLSTQDDLQMLTGLAIRPVLALPSEIRRATERFYMARMLQDAEAQDGAGASVDVYQEDSNLTEFRKIGKDTDAPLTTQRITDTSVTLRDGDTLVLSGLQKTARTVTHHKVPILGDLPLIGNLFRSSAKRTQRTELVVFLTPRVMNNANEARGCSERDLERLQKTTPEAKSRIVDPPAAPAPPE